MNAPKANNHFYLLHFSMVPDFSEELTPIIPGNEILPCLPEIYKGTMFPDQDYSVLVALAIELIQIHVFLFTYIVKYWALSKETQVSR